MTPAVGVAAGARSARVRHRLVVRGVVQGVGFRPFVHRLAVGLGLAGFVGNDTEGVFVEVEGPAAVVAAFEQALVASPPPMARVAGVDVVAVPVVGGESGFLIVASRNGDGAAVTFVAPDAAVCDDCVRELFDPGDRRHRYAFVTCTNCGPRFTITMRLPYDRPNTTMAGFELCEACSAEYHDPTDRRFHAQPLACPTCGPTLTFHSSPPIPPTTSPPSPPSPTMRHQATETVVPRRNDATPLPASTPVVAAALDCRPTPSSTPEMRRQATETVTSRRNDDGQPGDETTMRRQATVSVAAGRSVGDEAVAAAQEAVAQGLVLAVKGLGGYHLACDPWSDAAVATLRERKGRAEKPFALMVRDLAVAEQVAHVGPEEARLLRSPARPIVLLRARTGSGLSPLVAPGNPLIGVMLPYTPLHHLLFDPAPDALVMTSGNLTDEPIAYEDDDARRRLAHLADAWLVHDRPIHVPCDDSVVRVVEGVELPVRRSRGHAPLPVMLPFEAPSTLAVGGELKTTFCLASGRNAWISQHIGDMGSLETLAAFERSAAQFRSMYDVEPELHAADLHPGYHTRQWAERQPLAHGPSDADGPARSAGASVLAPAARPANGDDSRGDAARPARPGSPAAADEPEGIHAPTRTGLQAGTTTGSRVDAGEAGGGGVVLVQHHHAHVASLMAEHGVAPGERVIGVAYDGTGYGTDGAIWGGEVLLATYAGFDRAAHLAYVPLPGGDATIRKPFRAALAHLRAAGIDWSPDLAPVAAAPPDELRALERQIERDVQCVPTSSMGRLFDAVSSLLGLRHQVSYEAQAAMELEAVAAAGLADAADYRFVAFDAAPVLRAIVADLRSGRDVASVAAGFHLAVVRAVVEIAGEIRGRTGVDRVGLTGGVFQNALLLSATRAHLIEEGFDVLVHRVVPPNDGGLALGQVAVAAARTHPGRPGTQAAARPGGRPHGAHPESPGGQPTGRAGGAPSSDERGEAT